MDYVNVNGVFNASFLGLIVDCGLKCLDSQKNATPPQWLRERD